MTDIDPDADIEVHDADWRITVRLALAAPVTSEWLECPDELALAAASPSMPAAIASLSADVGKHECRRA
jgi:hypothetical protein